MRLRILRLRVRIPSELIDPNEERISLSEICARLPGCGGSDDAHGSGDELVTSIMMWSAISSVVRIRRCQRCGPGSIPG